MSKATRRQTEELRRLRGQADDAIDTADIPEVAGWSDAQRSRFYRPVK